jgi:cell division protein FtsQ
MTTDKRRRSRGGVVSLVVIAAVVGAWAVAASPLFHVRDVRVRGNRHLSTSEVVRLAGIRTDANLLTVQASRVRKGLARSPWVRTVEVRRELPWTLVVTVVERRAVGWVRHPGGIAVIAGDGTVLTRRKDPPRGITDLGVWKRKLRPGDHLEDMEEPLAVLASLPSRLRQEVQRASTRRGEVVLRLGEDLRVLYGQPRALDAKNAALARVLRWAGDQGVDLVHVDLRVARNPAVRIRGA